MNKISQRNAIAILYNCINDIKSYEYIDINGLNKILLENYDNFLNGKKEIENEVIINEREKQFCVFTDGSCENNGKRNAKAGYAIVFPNNREYDFSEKLLNNPTNNRAEYSAIIKALEVADIIDKDCKISLYIYTDSELLINSVTKWIKGWKKNNWITAKKTPVLNKDLLIIIDKYINKRNVVFKHVRAHTNNLDWESYWNNIVDEAAKKTLHNEEDIYDSDLKIKNILKQFGIN